MEDSKNYSVINHPDKLVINIHPVKKGIIVLSRTLFAAFFLVSSIFLFIIFFEILSDFDNSWFGWIFLLFLGAGSWLYIKIGVRIIKNNTQKESIILESQMLSLINKDIFKTIENKIPFTEIKSIALTEDQTMPEHPMASKNMDYIGLETLEKDVQNILKDGSINIETANNNFKTGIGLASWDAEEIMNIIRNYYHMS